MNVLTKVRRVIADRITIHPVAIQPVPRLALREPEAAEALSVSASWLRREAGAGRIPSALIGGIRLYPVAALTAWLAEQVSHQRCDAGEGVT